MIRKYTPDDNLEIIELFKLNTPTYFDSSEEIDLGNYLENEVEDYFVFEENSVILGGGGINYFKEEKIARISWDLIHPDFHGKGIGKELLKHRIQHINKIKEIDIIMVRTSQLAYQFYQKMGFELEKTTKDFWAKNFDLYQMKMNNMN